MTALLEQSAGGDEDNVAPASHDHELNVGGDIPIMDIPLASNQKGIFIWQAVNQNDYVIYIFVMMF